MKMSRVRITWLRPGITHDYMETGRGRYLRLVCNFRPQPSDSDTAYLQDLLEMAMKNVPLYISNGLFSVFASKVISTYAHTCLIIK